MAKMNIAHVTTDTIADIISIKDKPEGTMELILALAQAQDEVILHGKNEAYVTIHVTR